MTDKYVSRCPYCGGTDMAETYQGAYGATTVVGNAFRSMDLYHVICRNCGSVVRSYVKKPEKLISKKDREKDDWLK